MPIPPTLLPDADATEAWGQALAQALLARGLPGLLITLHGDLGAGKTTVVRALLRALGVSGRIKSPSYALVEPYAIEVAAADGTTLRRRIHHIDLYRFGSPDEWLDAGLDELFDGQTLNLVEWPERAPALLPHADLAIELQAVDGGRRLQLRAGSQAGTQLLSALQDGVR